MVITHFYTQTRRLARGADARCLVSPQRLYTIGALCLVPWLSTAGLGAEVDVPTALRTHQPIYQNPFDLASGGASLTRATQEGAFFVNPSLPAFGGGFHRWFFARTQVHLGDAQAKVAYDAYAKQSAQTPTPQELIAKAINKPVHIGHDTALGYINRFVSLVGFSNARADLQLRKFGDAGAPQLRVRSYGIGGGGVAAHVALGDTLALGVSSKYLEVAQVNTNLSLDDIQGSDDPAEQLPKLLGRGSGVSHDAGLTFQVRSRRIDLRVAATVHDISGTQLGSKLEPFAQTLAGGVGLTLHGTKHAAHCGADVRDILAAYGEHWTYRSYAGCKVLLYEWIGFGGGLSQGYPTAGMVIDLPGSRLEMGRYTREMGNQVGVEGRTVYFFAAGFEL